MHERLHNWLPGIEEHSPGANSAGSCADDACRRCPATNRGGRIATARKNSPPSSAPERRRARGRLGAARSGWSRLQAAAAVPLLAREVFASAGVPFRTFDSLPLAAEPTAAAMDLLLEAVDADFTRDSLIGLLRSPHLSFTVDGERLSGEAISALDRALSSARYLGDVARLEIVAAGISGTAAPAASVALQMARQLAPLRQPAPASGQLARLLGIWQSCLAPHQRERPVRNA